MADCSQSAQPASSPNSAASSGSAAASRSHSGTSRARAASGVRSAAGRSNSRSSAACTSVPRAVACVGGSGSRSITRNRYSSGHVMKSAARDGDSAGPVRSLGAGSASGEPGNTSRTAAVSSTLAP